jgi:hypothetical protein
MKTADLGGREQVHLHVILLGRQYKGSSDVAAPHQRDVPGLTLFFDRKVCGRCFDFLPNGIVHCSCGTRRLLSNGATISRTHFTAVTESKRFVYD